MESNNNIDVSIVIVCMNNLKNLYPCLESIRKFTNVSYECFVVAYLFSQENLESVKRDFPWVIFIKSNEIRGFSENNNLALRQAKGKYCFVVNDDTEMRMPVIDSLVNTIEKLPDKVAIVSPVTTHPDGKIQICGRAPITWWNSLMLTHKLYKIFFENKYCNKKGVFRSYNIIGAAFLIRTHIFESFGWFEEKYFFCPEDIALSTQLNKKGYECYVNADISIIHFEGMSGKSLSMVKTATKPAGDKGYLMFCAGNNYFLKVFLGLLYFSENITKCFCHWLISIGKDCPNEYKILAISEKHTCETILSKMTPKEIFIKYYKKLHYEETT